MLTCSYPELIAACHALHQRLSRVIHLIAYFLALMLGQKPMHGLMNFNLNRPKPFCWIHCTLGRQHQMNWWKWFVLIVFVELFLIFNPLCNSCARCRFFAISLHLAYTFYNALRPMRGRLDFVICVANHRLNFYFLLMYTQFEMDPSGLSYAQRVLSINLNPKPLPCKGSALPLSYGPNICKLPISLRQHFDYKK